MTQIEFPTVIDELSTEGLHYLLEQLAEPTADEQQLIDLIVQVDLRSRNANKWRNVAEAISARIGHLFSEGAIAGGGGMATPASSNQFSNRMRQVGVAHVDTTVFVIGDAQLLRETVANLKQMMALTSTVTRHALVVYRGQGTCRVVRLLAVEPGTDEVTRLLHAIAPQVPLQTVASSRVQSPVSSSSTDTINGAQVDDPGDSDTSSLIEGTRAWFVNDAGEDDSKYANVAGNSYQYKRTTRAGRDEVAAGHWLLLYRLAGVDAPEAGRIYGVARIHVVHKYGDVRYAIFDRFLRLDPAVELAFIGGDPRAGRQISITEIDPRLVSAVLTHVGVTHTDQVPVPAMRLSVRDVNDRLGGLRLPGGVVEQCVAALRSGKHLILRGPPGTGKSTLAVAITQAAHDVGLSRGKPIVTTGTSDWTSTDTVGGYRLDPALGADGLVFQSGFMLEAVDTDTWLVIDELNRADIDKAIGQFFSVLSGQSTLLPYVDADGTRLGVSVHGNSDEIGPYKVGEQWRLVATMNERDRDLLFNLSEALLRRFAVVTVPTLTALSDWDWLLENRASVPHPALALRLKALTRLKTPKLGPAIVIDCAQYIKQQVAMALESRQEPNLEAIMGSALDILVRPQLASLFGDELRLAERGLKDVAAGHYADDSAAGGHDDDVDSLDVIDDSPAGTPVATAADDPATLFEQDEANGGSWGSGQAADVAAPRSDS